MWHAVFLSDDRTALAGGEDGSDVVACNTSEDVVSVTASHTGRFLKDVLSAG